MSNSPLVKVIKEIKSEATDGKNKIGWADVGVRDHFIRIMVKCDNLLGIVESQTSSNYEFILNPDNSLHKSFCDKAKPQEGLQFSILAQALIVAEDTTCQCMEDSGGKN